METKKPAVTWFAAALWLLPALVLGAATTHNPDFMRECFLGGSFYCMALLVLGWTVVFKEWWDARRPDMRGFLREYGAGLLFCGALTAVIFVSVHSYFRVLSDEANLLSVSRSMTFQRSVHNVIQGKWTFYNLRPYEFIYEKRPFLFPYLQYWTHVFLGYRPSNPFVVNAACTLVLFCCLFVGLRKNLGDAAAYAGVLLAAAQPVLTQTATSAGIDMVFVMLITASLLTLQVFLDRPGPEIFALLWASLMLVANARYEGPMYAVLVFALLACMKKIRREWFGSSFVFAATPLMLLPTFWQRVFLKTDLEVPAGKQAFSLANFIENSMEFIRSQFRFDYFLPVANVVNILGFAAIVWLAVALARRKWPHDPAQRPFALIASSAAAAYAVVVYAHHSSFITDPAGARLMTFGCLVLSLLCLLFLLALFPGETGRAGVLLFSVGMFCLYHPVSVRNYFSNGLVLCREYRMVRDFLKDQWPRNYLVVTNVPGHYTALDRGAVKFTYANERRDELLTQFGKHLFSEIFVVQEVDVSGAVAQETLLDPAYKLEPVFESDHKMGVFIRISRVVNP
ncbi:MAG TPA: glycosyltransferase family 39 protein [Verrucomicrobiae bacterium]|nr:glycosyltransferase family 39 protein [Verrucomicrobiae bacterium]